MKKPYIKKYSNIANFTVWIVDGKYVRANIDEEFTNFGQHYRFKYIPKNEFWIDKEYGRGKEERYYVDHMLVENRLMVKGISYNSALERADLIEKRERKKSEIIFKKRKLHKSEIIKKIHKRLIKDYSKKVNVWVVNGELVRDLFCIDFTEGGHDLVYPFIPETEVWIDDDIGSKERKFIVLHELHERNLMSRGWKYHPHKSLANKIKNNSKTHESAHLAASEVEYYYRRHAKGIEIALKREMG